MKIQFFSLLIALLAFNGCTDKKETMANQNLTEETQKPNADKVKPLTIEMGYNHDKSDPLTVKNAEITGNILTLTVSYSGGCETHEMDLIFNGAYMKSMPPQGNLYLKHNANGDNCRALIQEELQFDLSEIGKTQSHVFFRVDGYKEKLEYKSK